MKYDSYDTQRKASLHPTCHGSFSGTKCRAFAPASTHFQHTAKQVGSKARNQNQKGFSIFYTWMK